MACIAPIAWGSTYFVTSKYLPADYPLYGAFIRALPAGLLLLLAGRALPRGSWWWKSVVLGALNMSIFFALVYVASQLLPSSVASVVMALSPVVMMGLAWVWVSERPAAVSVLGAVLGIAGVCIMLLTGSESVNLLGLLASVSAMTLASVGFVLAKRWSGQVPALAATSWQLIAGSALLLPAARIFEGLPPSLDTGAVLGFAYMSLIATALAYGSWFMAMRHLPVGQVGLIGLLNPVTGVLLGTMLASERLTLQQVVGVALVLVGIWLGNSKGTKQRRS